MSPTSVKNRRAHERIDTEIEVQGIPGADGVPASMVARNLSLGGLYCTSTTDFPEMTRLAVRLIVPVRGVSGEGQPVDVEAVVVRRQELPRLLGPQEYQLALYFTRMDGDTRVKLERFLDQPSH